MKNILVFGLALLANIIMNFAVLIISYNTLATPFLHEQQRMENAPYLFAIALPCFIGIAVVSALIIYFIVRKKS